MELGSHIKIISGVAHFPPVRKDFAYTVSSSKRCILQCTYNKIDYCVATTDGEPVVIGRRSGGGEIFVDVQVTCTTYNETLTPGSPCSDHPPVRISCTNKLNFD
jgi:hypothetical protein